MKKLKIWVIISFSLIIIGRGHGIGPLIFIDIFSINQFIENGFTLPNYNDDDSENHFFIVGLFSLLGKLLILLSILKLIKKEKYKILISFIGLLCLFISFYKLTFQNWNDGILKVIVLVTGIPFLISSCFLFTKSIDFIKKNGL